MKNERTKRIMNNRREDDKSRLLKKGIWSVPNDIPFYNGMSGPNTPKQVRKKGLIGADIPFSRGYDDDYYRHNHDIPSF